jgi:hypothetical protein
MLPTFDPVMVGEVSHCLRINLYGQSILVAKNIGTAAGEKIFTITYLIL